MPNIPYPEFNDFRLELTKKVVGSAEPVEGFAFLSMNDNPNCVKDILIALRCCFRYRTDDGTTHTVLLHEEIQRNATPFDDAGLPEGEYEFPFSFTCPETLPPSVYITGGWDTLNNCKIWYEIRAYVMHAEGHAFLDRKHLRTSVKFQRTVSYVPETEHLPTLNNKSDFEFNKLFVHAELEKDIFVIGEPLYLNVRVKNELMRNITGVKLSIRQVVTVRKRSMRQVKEFVTKHTVGQVEVTGKGIPIKRHQMYSARIAITPEFTPDDTGSSYGGVALAGTLEQGEKELATTITRHTPEGIDVNYFLQINLPVMFGSDTIITLPFILSNALPDNDGLPSYWTEEASDEPRSIYKITESTRTLGAEQEEDDEENDETLPSYNDIMASSSSYGDLSVSGSHGNLSAPSSTAGSVHTSAVPMRNDHLAAPSTSAAAGHPDRRLGKRLTVQMSKPMVGSTDEYAYRALNMDSVGAALPEDGSSDKGKGAADDAD